MKHPIFLSALLAISLFASCNTETNNPADDAVLDSNLISGEIVNNPATLGGSTNLDSMAVLAFKDTVHNFGTISEGEIATYDFVFTNEGKTPLLISNATASCGCTVPEKPSEPIMPGGSDKIKVSFNSEGRPGSHEKTVTVINNSRTPNQELKIKVEVRAKK